MTHADESIKPDECQIKVELTDGMELEKHVQHAAGSLEVPRTRKQLAEKFLDQSTTDISHVDASNLSERYS
jgi:aconitate decarboxylase